MAYKGGNKTIINIFTICLLVLATSACSSQLSSTESENGSTPMDQIGQEANGSKPPESNGGITPEPDEPNKDSVSGQPSDDSAVQNGSAEIVPTDPSTVSLASGQLQFIEFFAYW